MSAITTVPIVSWFLKYLKEDEEEPMFYSSYGSFMHRIIERFYRGELTKEEMPMEFLLNFGREVRGERPKDSIVQSYIEKGLAYLKGFLPFPYDMVGVEQKVDFEIDGRQFVGFIDYLGEKDGEFYIVDNKSRDLKPRSGKKKPTAKDKELDEMLRQLYIYAEAVRQTRGKFPKALCFNCFKAGTFIEEPFNENAYNEAMEWVRKNIAEIENADDFHPNIEFFSCKYLCGLKDECCYYQMR